MYDPIDTPRSQEAIDLIYRYCLESIKTPRYHDMIENCLEQIQNINIPIKRRFDLLYLTHDRIKNVINSTRISSIRGRYMEVNKCLINILVEFVQSGQLPPTYPTRFNLA